LTESIGGSFGIVVGLVVASLLFALMHPMTATYAMVAGVISLYLGWIWLLTGNLLVPITAHAFYDFVVLIYLVRFRKPAGG
jgi:membrane protease YdiL (CAAX protease family)